MKYTRENLIGIGVETKNTAQSREIVKKFRELGMCVGWNGSASNGYYGWGVGGDPICCGEFSVTRHFPEIISYEEFMNEDIILSNQKIEENYEIY